MMFPFYSLFSVLSIIILLLFYFHTLGIKTDDEKTLKAFQLLLIWNIFFAFQDGIWGLCDAGVIKGTLPFFISSTIFHLSTVTTTSIWTNYVLAATKTVRRNKKIILGIAGFFFLLQAFLLIVNFFTPTIFTISQDGKYITAFLRPIAFFNQYLLYFVAGVVALFKILKTEKKQQALYVAVLLFVIAPILSGYLQYKFPDAPFYTVGYLIGCTIIHLFVASTQQVHFLKNYISEQEENYQNYYIKSQNEINRNIEILYSMAEVYYSMHVIDLLTDTVIPYSARNEVKSIVNKTNGATVMMKQVITETVIDGFRDSALAFTDLSTLPDRMKNKKIIEAEFIGLHTGWFVASFIAIRTNEYGKPTKVIFTSRSIDEEKKKEEHLIYKSNTDEMTGFYNRRAYENAINNYKQSGLEDDFAYVAIDVNGLKNVNDSIGHEAGDELIIGACECIKKVFGTYGRLFRTGGDEFVVLMNADEARLNEMKAEIETVTQNWRGKLVDSLSLSCGYVSKAEAADFSLHQIVVLADKRMYEAKSSYYRKAGVDRRGQSDAHKALCLLYTKILKINITEDCYKIVNMNKEELSGASFSNKISEWLLNFGISEQVHPDDLAEYQAKTNLEYLKNYFKANSNPLIFFYKRKYGDAYKQAMMQIIPASDYSDESQSLFLYVNNIEN